MASKTEIIKIACNFIPLAADALGIQRNQYMTHTEKYHSFNYLSAFYKDYILWVFQGKRKQKSGDGEIRKIFPLQKKNEMGKLN